MKMTIFSIFGHCLASRDKTVKHFCWNMAFPALKILFTLIAFLFFGGLRVDCKVEKYAFNIVENETSFKEEVELDVDEQTEVFRVPQHNDVDAAEVMNDFTSALSVLRDPVRKVCFVSKLDSSFPSPEKLKLDMDQASRQSSVPNEVSTKRERLDVTGFADRSALPQKILKFCGTFPIYKIKKEEMPLDTLNTSLSQTISPARFKRQSYVHPMIPNEIPYKLCSHYDRSILENCLNTVGLMGITDNCKTGRIYCLYIVKCRHLGAHPLINQYSCRKISHRTLYGICCTPSC